MSLVSKLKNPDSTLRWIRTPEGAEFLALLNDEVNKNFKTLQSASEVKDIFKAQGALNAIYPFTMIETEIVRYNEDVKNGKIKPLIKDVK